MSKNPFPAPEVLERIHFDTLLEQAEEVVRIHAATTWTDLAEHDPGITLLEALAYGVSDVAYRHALPLKDLLTPQPQPGASAQDLLFPADFGPHRALTSSPITVDDYRRALLDLHSSDAEGSIGVASGDAFYFRDAQLLCEPQDKQFRYSYNPVDRLFRFPPGGAEGGQELTVFGGYQLLIELNRGVLKKEAQPVLDAFLLAHRNLCEAVRDVAWLDPQGVNVQLEVELDDDCRTPAKVMAEIYRVVEAQIRPEALRYTAQELAQQGLRNEEIYEGPRLLHGWIPQLPPAPDYSRGVTLSLSPLAQQLLKIEGISSIKKLGFVDAAGQDLGWELTLIPPNYPLLWTSDPIAELTSNRSKVKLFKQGQQLRPTASEVRAELSPPVLINEGEVLLHTTRWRKPAAYHSASERLPPCYGLQDPEPGPLQTQLHQFMLTFEQQLSNACHQLALLPTLLAFDRQSRPAADTTVWGGQWPFLRDKEVDDIANQVHRNYRPALEEETARQGQSADKELQIINYLLGYFGASRAPHTLESVTPSEFLAVQRAYLQQQAELGYGRASIRVDQVSALQRRIAARLGMGEALFKDPVNLAQLPFYVVEHRALLPEQPNNTAYAGEQIPLDVKEEGSEGSEEWSLVMQITIKQGIALKPGQSVDFLLAPAATSSIGPCMISKVNGDRVYFSIKNHARLQTNLDRILGAAALRWRNSETWLQDKSFRLNYAPSTRIDFPLDFSDPDVDHEWIAMTVADDEKFEPGQEINFNVSRGNQELFFGPYKINTVASKKIYFFQSDLPDAAFLYDAYNKGELRWFRFEGLNPSGQIARLEIQPYPPSLTIGNTIEIVASEVKNQWPAVDGLSATIKEADPILGKLTAELPEGKTWPAVGSGVFYWYIDHGDAEIEDRFSFTLSVVFPRSLLAGVAEPYTTQAWIKQIVQEEIPCHISAQVHWFEGSLFGDFAKTYAAWQNGGAPLGDLSYRLLEQLALGQLPTDEKDINVMRIYHEDMGPRPEPADGGWKAFVDKNEAFHVKKPINGEH